MIAQGLVDQRLVQAAWQGAVSEVAEGPREGRLAGDRRALAPAAQATQRPVDDKALDERAGGRDGEHRLGAEGSCQRGPIRLRAPGKPRQHVRNGSTGTNPSTVTNNS